VGWYGTEGDTGGAEERETSGVTVQWWHASVFRFADQKCREGTMLYTIGVLSHLDKERAGSLEGDL